MTWKKRLSMIAHIKPKLLNFDLFEQMGSMFGSENNAKLYIWLVIFAMSTNIVWWERVWCRMGQT